MTNAPVFAVVGHPLVHLCGGLAEVHLLIDHRRRNIICKSSSYT